jgi:hypothetical protein
MRHHITPSALLWTVCAALAVALASRSGWWLPRLPRSVWPLLISCYLAWAAINALIVLCSSFTDQPKTLPRLGPWCAPSVVLVALVVIWGVEETYRRWSGFRSRAGYHYLQEALCRSSARGEQGELILEFPYGCQIGTVPEANETAGRVQMLAAAEGHARLRLYWESRW